MDTIAVSTTTYRQQVSNLLAKNEAHLDGRTYTIEEDPSGIAIVTMYRKGKISGRVSVHPERVEPFSLFDSEGIYIVDTTSLYFLSIL